MSDQCQAKVDLLIGDETCSFRCRHAAGHEGHHQTGDDCPVKTSWCVDSSIPLVMFDSRPGSSKREAEGRKMFQSALESIKKPPEKCGAVARFTCHGKPVVCSMPAGHRGNHLSANVGSVPISWREGRTIEGDIGPQIDKDMRQAFEPLAKWKREGGGDE